MRQHKHSLGRYGGLLGVGGVPMVQLPRPVGHHALPAEVQEALKRRAARKREHRRRRAGGSTS